MKPLTETQQKILEFIQSFTEEHGYSPSFRDIQKHMGFLSTNGVMSPLRPLRKKGYLLHCKNTNRSMVVIKGSDTPQTRLIELASQVANSDDPVSLIPSLRRAVKRYQKHQKAIMEANS